eukprot:8830549-Pyramimonas_sp.AAC.1
MFKDTLAPEGSGPERVLPHFLCNPADFLELQLCRYLPEYSAVRFSFSTSTADAGVQATSSGTSNTRLPQRQWSS